MAMKAIANNMRQITSNSGECGGIHSRRRSTVRRFNVIAGIFVVATIVTAHWPLVMLPDFAFSFYAFLWLPLQILICFNIRGD